MRLSFSHRALCFLSVACAIGLVGCASSTEPEAADAAVVSSDGASATSCETPSRYFAALPDPCAVVAGTGGAWVPEPLFEGAAPSQCTYVWTSDSAAVPDGAGLREAFPIWTLVPACGTSLTDIGELESIPVDEVAPTTGQVGSVGCDVCGWQAGDRMWAVLPPTLVDTRRFSVWLTNYAIGFEIKPSAARVLEIKLPPAPPGEAYRTGFVQIY